MKTIQSIYSLNTGWQPDLAAFSEFDADLILVFGPRSLLQEYDFTSDIRKSFPPAHIMGCSTAGQIAGTSIYDDYLVLTAIEFEHTSFNGCQKNIDSASDSYETGRSLANELKADDLVHLLVLSDGLKVNGSELVRGLTSVVPPEVSITGGLAGDNDAFQETLTFWDSPPLKDNVVVLGLYGNRLRIGYGSRGGWDPFGPERIITRSKGNILYEMDGRSALQLYKAYLGEHAHGLPATGLLFPLSIRNADNGPPLVRTILGVNEEDESLTFAGDLPLGSLARLMKANIDRLIDGAISAAEASRSTHLHSSPVLAILISCVGRRLVLKQRTEEEVEGVSEAMSATTMLAGFYSYGEICPSVSDGKPDLHNQTMTITTFYEV
ncbi:MAG: FIST signal transduction protein [Deltaproteobacteria bacterium]